MLLNELRNYFHPNLHLLIEQLRFWTTHPALGRQKKGPDGCQLFRKGAYEWQLVPLDANVCHEVPNAVINPPG